MSGRYYIGVDLGTSAVKLLLVDEQGKVLRSESREYPLAFPRPGWCEQNPGDWTRACEEGLAALLSGEDASQVAAIGVAGQMHGLVALDAAGQVIRPAILWNDGRTAQQVEYLNGVIGKDRLTEYTANIAFAGFTAPKLLWMQQEEPELYARIAKIMLPKDYVNLWLTGEHACDYSDASGMLLLDVQHRRWSEEMLRICGVEKAWLPRLYESCEVIGTVRPELAKRLGLSPSVKVVAGAGDNAAAAVGTGTVTDGACNISLGTSGTLFIASDRFCADQNNALHAFAHASGGWHLMGVVLSAASCNKWLCEEILHTSDFAAEQAAIAPEKLGRNPVFFLPYLMGERSPINDTDARGTLVGLSMDTGRADLVQAVLEGVSFALRDSFEVARALGLSIPASTLCGGGAKSPLWRRILANVLNIPIRLPAVEEGPGYGGALLAMVGDGAYDTVAKCAGALTGTTLTVEPEQALAARYQEQYEKFRAIYPALRPVFPALR